MTFVDTSAWYTSIVPSDPNHAAAMDWLRRNDQPLVTTDYVVDEILTLLSARGLYSRAIKFGQQIFAGDLALLYHLTEADIRSAWEVFQKFSDKDWSFTDCTSKAIIEKLDVEQSFSFDRHFEQFGSVRVVP